MLQPNLESASPPPPSVLTKKQPITIYTVMLIVSLIALLIGCIFLYMEIGEYGGFGQIKGPVASLVTPAFDIGQSLLA